MNTNSQHQHQLHQVHQPSAVRMQLLSDTANIRVGEEVRLVFRPVDMNQPEQALQLGMQHEAAIHLIIVNSSLTTFQHLHPTQDGDGNYVVEVVFDRPDNYLLYADFQVEGLAPQTDRIQLSVGDLSTTRFDDIDEQLTATVDGMELTIQPHTAFTAEAESHIPLRITKGGNAVDADNIQPYLGAVAHIILISLERKDFLHIHPMSNHEFPIIGHTVFPQSGIYRMWVQFKTNDVLHTARFTLNVKEGQALLANTHHHHGHHHHHHNH